MTTQQIIKALEASQQITSQGHDLGLFNGRIVTVIQTGRGLAYSHTNQEAIDNARIKPRSKKKIAKISR